MGDPWHAHLAALQTQPPHQVLNWSPDFQNQLEETKLISQPEIWSKEPFGSRETGFLPILCKTTIFCVSLAWGHPFQHDFRGLFFLLQ